MPDYDELTLETFAQILGTTTDDIPADQQALFQASDFGYRKLLLAERDQVIRDILGRLDSDSFSRVGQARKGIWEKAWSERAQDFQNANYAPEGLIPNYIDANPIVRLNGDFVRPRNANFERSFSAVLRPWLFTKFLGSAQTIYEFGCGSGFNLVTLGRLYPEKNLVGLDWASSAIQLVNLIGEHQGLKVTGRQFDFFTPDPLLTLEPQCAVVTMCALEQIGANHREFIQFLINQRPTICLHMEPLCELYDGSQLVDYLAIRYHKQRGYLDGLLEYLQTLAAENRIEIIQTQRVSFGSLYHEGYSFVVWRPVTQYAH